MLRRSCNYGKAAQSRRTVVAALPLWRPMSFKRLAIVFLEPLITSYRLDQAVYT
jgi:hypothetical protein